MKKNFLKNKKNIITYALLTVICITYITSFIGCADSTNDSTSSYPVIDEVEGESGPKAPEKIDEIGDAATDNADLTIIPSDFTYPEWDEEDLNTDFTSEDVQIVGEGKNVTITGEGAEAKKGNVTITTAGTYVLSGTFEGQILIEAEEKDIVHLVLKSADITCTNNAAIYGKQSKKIIITLAKGTENSVTDGEEYKYANTEEKEDHEPNAAIFSKDDLVINGEGSLIVTANYEEGIRSKDDLRIASGIFEITAKDDAVCGKDSLWIGDGDFTVNAGNDAFKSTNDEDSDKGWTLIEDGSFDVAAVGDAFHAETYMIIEDGDIDIKGCEEGIEGLKVEIYGGNISVVSTDDGINAANSNMEEALERENAKIAIYGGNLFVNAEGDGIDSNGVLYIYGGEITVEGPTGNDNASIDYDTTALIKEGTLLATGSAGMAVGFSKESEQGWMLYVLPEKKAAGETITILNKNEEIIFEAAPNKEYQSIIISTSEFENGEAYTLICGDVEEEFTLENNSYSNSRGFGPGGGMMPFGEREGFDSGVMPPEPPEGMEGERPEPPQMP